MMDMDRLLPAYGRIMSWTPPTAVAPPLQKSSSKALVVVVWEAIIDAMLDAVELSSIFARTNWDAAKSPKKRLIIIGATRANSMAATPRLSSCKLTALRRWQKWSLVIEAHF